MQDHAIFALPDVERRRLARIVRKLPQYRLDHLADVKRLLEYLRQPKRLGADRIVTVKSPDKAAAFERAQ